MSTTERREIPASTTDRQRFLDGLAAFQRSLYRVGIDPAAVTIVLQPNDKDKLLHALDLSDWDDITAPGRPTRLRGTIIDEAKK